MATASNIHGGRAAGAARQRRPAPQQQVALASVFSVGPINQRSTGRESSCRGPGGLLGGILGGTGGAGRAPRHTRTNNNGAPAGTLSRAANRAGGRRHARDRRRRLAGDPARYEGGTWGRAATRAHNTAAPPKINGGRAGGGWPGGPCCKSLIVAGPKDRPASLASPPAFPSPHAATPPGVPGGGPMKLPFFPSGMRTRTTRFPAPPASSTMK